MEERKLTDIPTFIAFEGVKNIHRRRDATFTWCDCWIEQRPYSESDELPEGAAMCPTCEMRFLSGSGGQIETN